MKMKKKREKVRWEVGMCTKDRMEVIVKRKKGRGINFFSGGGGGGGGGGGVGLEGQGGCEWSSKVFVKIQKKKILRGG